MRSAIHALALSNLILLAGCTASSSSPEPAAEVSSLENSPWRSCFAKHWDIDIQGIPGKAIRRDGIYLYQTTEEFPKLTKLIPELLHDRMLRLGKTRLVDPKKGIYGVHLYRMRQYQKEFYYLRKGNELLASQEVEKLQNFSRYCPIGG